MPEAIKCRLIEARKTMNGRYKAVTISIEESIELEAVFSDTECLSIAAIEPLNPFQIAAFSWACKFIEANQETIKSSVSKWD